MEDVAVTTMPGTAEQIPAPKIDSPQFSLIRDLIDNVLPGTPTVPGLMIAATDARLCTGTSNHVLQFTSVIVEVEGYEKIHGYDERYVRVRNPVSHRINSYSDRRSFMLTPSPTLPAEAKLS